MTIEQFINSNIQAKEVLNKQISLSGTGEVHIRPREGYC
jgi:hypothetical protein